MNSLIKANLENKLKIPSGLATPVKSSEGEFLFDFLKKHKIKKTMEIGLGYGRSASYIMTATESKHIAIDPFQENYKFSGIKNIKNVGLQKKLYHLPEFSHAALPKLVKKKEFFDFIFIDGDHKFDGIFLDFYYSDLLVSNKGFIVLHDTWMRSTQIVISFIKTNRKDYSEIKTNQKNMVVFQKQSTDQRSGMFHKEFFSFNKLFSYNLKIQIEKNKLACELIKKIFIVLKKKMKTASL